MLKIRGKYTEVKIYSETAEEYAIAQVKMICDNETAVGSKICMMPDIHPGKVGPVGLTMTVGGRIIEYELVQCKYILFVDIIYCTIYIVLFRLNCRSI